MSIMPSPKFIREAHFTDASNLQRTGVNPKEHLGKRKEKEEGKEKERKAKQKQKRWGNLGENPKGRQGRLSAASKHEEEQLVTWFIWDFSSFL